jgi:hypothetical protein
LSDSVHGQFIQIIRDYDEITKYLNFIKKLNGAGSDLRSSDTVFQSVWSMAAQPITNEDFNGDGIADAAVADACRWETWRVEIRFRPQFRIRS